MGGDDGLAARYASLQQAHEVISQLLRDTQQERDQLRMERDQFRHERDVAQGQADRVGLEIGRLQTELGRMEGRLEVVSLERQAAQGRLDAQMAEVATLRAQVAGGGGLDEVRRLRTEMEELRERVGFYRGRYHAAVPAAQIEHYRRPTRSGTARTHTGMQGGEDSGWSVGGSERAGGSQHTGHSHRTVHSQRRDTEARRDEAESSGTGGGLMGPPPPPPAAPGAEQ